MKHHQRYLSYKLAAGGGLLLAAILIAACSANTLPTGPTEPGAASQPPAAPSPTARPTNTASVTETSPAPTRTASRTSTATKSPSPGGESLPSGRLPTSTPSPAAVARQPSAGAIEVYETTITLPTYPFEDYLIEQVDPIYNIPVLYFNRNEYEAAAPTPTAVDYTGVVLENPYLRLTFLPELGGRLYSAVVKSTKQEIFYHNPVVKPSRYGILQPVEANWWLAAGGMEWAYPTQEHGYRWGVPWGYTIKKAKDRATITLSDTAPKRVGVEVEVTLAAQSALFTVAPKLVNAGPDAIPVQFWLNAALSLAPHSMSPHTRFIVPVEEVTVHSRGGAGWTLPDAHQQAPWPIVSDRDLSDYNQWTDYLGFFVPDLDSPFIGAYNPDTNLGVIRLIDSGAVPGHKLFAFSKDFLFRDYTDDDSQYFEIWGGANAGFWPEDDILVARGEMLQWQERWWPVTGLDGITWATEQATIHIAHLDNMVHLSALVSSPTQGQLTVLAEEKPIFTEQFLADPATPLKWQLDAVDEPIRVQLLDDSGKLLLDYESPGKKTSPAK